MMLANKLNKTQLQGSSNNYNKKRAAPTEKKLHPNQESGRRCENHTHLLSQKRQPARQYLWQLGLQSSAQAQENHGVNKEVGSSSTFF